MKVFFCIASLSSEIRGKIICVHSPTAQYRQIFEKFTEPIYWIEFLRKFKIDIAPGFKIHKTFEMMQVTRLAALNNNNLKLLDQIFLKLCWLLLLSPSDEAWLGNTVKTNFFLYHNNMKCVSKILISNLLCCGETDFRLQFVTIFTILFLLIIRKEF